MRDVLKAAAFASVLAGLHTGAAAATVGFSFNAGPVTFVEMGSLPSEFAAIQGFQLGEDVIVTFTIDDGASDLQSGEQRGEFEDGNGTITLTGEQSATIVEMVAGVNVQLDDVAEFDLRNIRSGADPDMGFELFDDIDYSPVIPVLTDPDDLGTSIAQLAALAFPDGFLVPNAAIGSDARVGVNGAEGAVTLLAFGPVPVPIAAPVPLPAGLPLLAAAVGALGIAGRRARVARRHG